MSTLLSMCVRACVLICVRAVARAYLCACARVRVCVCVCMCVRTCVKCEMQCCSGKSTICRLQRLFSQKSCVSQKSLVSQKSPTTADYLYKQCSTPLLSVVVGLFWGIKPTTQASFGITGLLGTETGSCWGWKPRKTELFWEKNPTKWGSSGERTLQNVPLSGKLANQIVMVSMVRASCWPHCETVHEGAADCEGEHLVTKCRIMTKGNSCQRDGRGPNHWRNHPPIHSLLDERSTFLPVQRHSRVASPSLSFFRYR